MSSTSVLLTTKLFLPTPRPNLVARPRLLQVLDHSPHARLILVSAPPGFGKSTLITTWIAAQNAPEPARSHNDSQQLKFCWLSLDESDNDPVHFLAYLLAAFQNAEPTIGATAQIMLQAPQRPPITALLTIILNDLSSRATPICLILDDYHVITAQAIHEAITFLVEQLPPPVRLVITSRVDPPLPLARWRVRRVLTEIRANDLRFTPAEAAEFLRDALGNTLPDEVVETLETRTEGWVAGLQLAALSMQGRADVGKFVRHFTGSHVFIIDYLAEEVLHKLPAATQNFLLQTSILERFCAALCDAVIGRSDAQLFLEQIQRANLFLIPLDDHREWFRYHHLFAEVLQNRLQQGGNDLTAALHRRATYWYAQQNLLAEAIHHAFAATDLELAAGLIEQGLDQWMKRGEQTIIAGWLEKLPRAVCLARPRLALAYSNILIIRHDLTAADDWLQRLTVALTAVETDPQIWGELLYQRANAASRQFDFERTRAYSEQGLAAVAADDWSLRAKLLLMLGLAYYYTGKTQASHPTFAQATRFALAGQDLYIALYGINNQAEALYRLGRLAEARQSFETGLQLVQEHALDHLAIANQLHHGLALLLYEVNELAAMQVHLDQALARRYWMNPLQTLFNQVGLAMLQFARGQLAAALTTVEQTLAQLTEQNFPLEDASVAQQLRVYLWLDLGEQAAASQWAAASNLPLDPVNMTRQMEYLALVRVLLVEGRASAALTLLGRLHQAAQADEQENILVVLLALQALAWTAAGNSAAGQASLVAAVERGRKGGFMRSLVTLGAPLQRLLTRYRQSPNLPTELSGYLDQLLAAFPPIATQLAAQPAAVQLPSSRPTAAANTGGLVEPLSERELAVLRLVAAGHSNSQIAAQLIVTVGTVKRHLNNIFGKLQVTSRTQAIARARMLELL